MVHDTHSCSQHCLVLEQTSGSWAGACEGPSGGSRAAAAVADGCREVHVSAADGCSSSACTSATTIPVARLVDIWPPISSGFAWPLGYLRAETPTWEGPTDPNTPWLPEVGGLSYSLCNFYWATTTIKGRLLSSRPMLKPFSGEKICPVEIGPKNGGFWGKWVSKP